MRSQHWHALCDWLSIANIGSPWSVHAGQDGEEDCPDGGCAGRTGSFTGEDANA